jgi:hypothetical protein
MNVFSYAEITAGNADDRENWHCQGPWFPLFRKDAEEWGTLSGAVSAS